MDESVHNADHFFGGIHQSFTPRISEVVQVLGKKQLGLQFEERSTSVVEKSSVIAGAAVTSSLSNIAGNGRGCPPQLLRDPKDLCAWKRSRGIVNACCQPHRFLPRDKFTKSTLGHPMSGAIGQPRKKRPRTVWGNRSYLGLRPYPLPATLGRTRPPRHVSTPMVVDSLRL